jgi:hypothetical protein
MIDLARLASRRVVLWRLYNNYKLWLLRNNNY